MNTRILNRDFTHPADGWYHIESKGLHPNARAKLVQVIDDQACQSIVNKFNAHAATPNYPGMLIDIEHFKHDDNKETRAYGWLMKLANRNDGLYGQIRWSTTGKAAVDGGDYRFFSTEYDASDLETVPGSEMQNSALRTQNSKLKYVRPLALAGLTLTNVNNNKGQKPITNRMKRNNAPLDNKENDTAEPDDSKAPEALAASVKANDASKAADSPRQHEAAAVLHRKAQKLCASCGKDETAEYHGGMAEHHDDTADAMRDGVDNREFPSPTNRDTDRPQTSTEEPTMKKVLLALGLAEGASEDAALSAVNKITNRVKELETAQIETDLKVYADRIGKDQTEFIKSALVTNRAGTIAFLEKQPKLATAPARVTNRKDMQEAAPDAGMQADDDQSRATAIAEGIRSIRVANREATYAQARAQLRREKPELFQRAKQ